MILDYNESRIIERGENMDCLFELLFLAWCKSYSPEEFSTDHDYGLYAFREGLQLGLCLAASALGEWAD